MPFVGQANGKGRFLNVTICAVKLRNFESKYRCNATEAFAWVCYIPMIRCSYYKIRCNVELYL